MEQGVRAGPGAARVMHRGRGGLGLDLAVQLGLELLHRLLDGGLLRRGGDGRGGGD
jgi:hypothetical protein